MALDIYDSVFWPTDSWSTHAWPLGFWPIASLGPLYETYALWHPPSRILRDYLTRWLLVPDIITSQLPDEPDDLGAVYDTSPLLEARVHTEQPRRYHGLQIVLRDRDENTGYQKAHHISEALARVENRRINIGVRAYRLKTIRTVTDVFPLGTERGGSGRRQLFSMNFLAVIIGLEHRL